MDEAALHVFHGTFITFPPYSGATNKGVRRVRYFRSEITNNIELLAVFALCCLLLFTVFLSLRGFSFNHSLSADNLYQMTAAASKQEEVFLQELETQLSAVLQIEAANGAKVVIPSTVKVQEEILLNKHRLPHQKQQPQRAAPEPLLGDFILEPFATITPLPCDKAVGWAVERGFHIEPNSIKCTTPERGSSYCRQCSFFFSWSPHLPFTSYW